MSSAEGEGPGTVKDRSMPRLALVHQKGQLICASSRQTAKMQNGEYLYKVLFAETGRKNTVEYSVPVRWTKGGPGSETAVINLKDMPRHGGPKQTGTAILLSVVDELDDSVDCLLIKNPPKAFVNVLHGEQKVWKTKDGYLVERHELKQFLERRLGLAE